MSSSCVNPRYVLLLFSWCGGILWTALNAADINDPHRVVSDNPQVTASHAFGFDEHTTTILSSRSVFGVNLFPAIASLTIADVSANEDDGTVTVSVTLNNSVLGGFSVDARTENGSATTQDGDFTAINAETLAFLGLAGETRSITISLGADSKVEADETFEVSLSNVRGLLISAGDIDATNTGIVKIVNDDSAVLRIDNGSGDEGGGAITLTATLDRAVDGGFTVQMNTTNGTATGGADFTAFSGKTLTFSGTAGEAQNFTVSPIDDSQSESDETLTVGMNNLLPAKVTSGAIDVSDEATVTIVDNDETQSTVQISVNNAIAFEDNSESTLTFTVSLDNASGSSLTVDYATSNGTATSGSDYEAASGTLSFAAGEASKTVSVTVLGDQVVERDETFTLMLSNNTGQSSISDATGTGTISNDDEATVLIANVSGTEDGGAITLTATLDRAVDGGFTVQVNTTNGTATGGADFTAFSGKALTFSGTAGEAQNFTVAPIDDSQTESDETLIINMDNLISPTVAAGAIDVSNEATVTIVDNETPDGDHTPVVVADQVFEVSDSMENGDQLGTVQANDADQGTTFSDWTILSGNEAGTFALGSSTGVLSVADISQLDSSQDEYVLSVSVSDGTNTSEAATVTVKVVNEAATGPGVNLTLDVVDITNQQEVVIIATFETKVSGFDPADILVINGEASDLSTDDSIVYTFKASASSDGTVAVSIPASSAQDGAGNGNKASNEISYFYDGSKPVATLNLADQGQLPDATIFIDFSESVTGLSEGDFELTSGSISSLSGSLNAYTLELTNIADDQTTITLVAGAVSDEAGNMNEADSIIVSNDVTGPTEFIPSFIDPIINTRNQKSISFQIALTEKGSTYIYQIASEDSSETLDGSGNSTGGTVVEVGLDLSSFPDGEILLIVTMTDEVGNVGSTKTDQVLKNTSVEIPQGISPNGDGANDTWVIPGIENYPQNRVTIFNRWGNLVYQAIGYDNRIKVFAGQSNNDFSLGNSLSNGTYFYVIDLDSEDVRKGYLIINK